MKKFSESLICSVYKWIVSGNGDNFETINKHFVEGQENKIFPIASHDLLYRTPLVDQVKTYHRYSWNKTDVEFLILNGLQVWKFNL